MDYKERARQAILLSHQRQLDNEKPGKPKRKNKKPEQAAVQEICAWLKDNGFSYNIVEASTFDGRTGRNTAWTVKAGFSDIVACCPHGIACYIEVKAAGKLRTLSEKQREFLTDKINHRAFAGVFDSAARLSQLYSEYIRIRKEKGSTSAYLLEQLPPPPKRRDANQPLFSDLE